MAAKKKASNRPAKTAPEDQGAASGPNALTGAVYHNGRMYDHRKRKDQEDFKRLVEKEGGLAPASITDKAERKKFHQEELQRLAERNALKGYGTKAAAKKAGRDEEDTGVSTETMTEEELRERTGAGEEGTGED